MGGAKERWLEQGDHGHSLDLGQNFLGVCPECIADEALRRFVGGNGPIERCHFCGGDGPQGIRLGTLFDYMGDRISTEWDLAIEELYPGEGDEVWESGGASVYDAWDLLWELGEPLANEQLREAFVAAFPDDRISRHAFRLAYHQQLAYGWETFARYVKEESRFLFLRTGRGPQGDEELFPPAQLLDEVGMAIENGGLIHRLPAGTQLVRARQHAPEEILATPTELGSPPPACAAANRMSPPGISMFYGAEDVETALAELRPQLLARCATVATWTTARPLPYLDLVDVVVPSLFDMVGKSQRPWLLFLRRFAQEVSQPVSPGGAAVDYVPTQVFTEYVRHVLGDRDGPVRGIRYRSSVRSEGVSWVLFVDAEGCTGVAPAWHDDQSRWLGMEPSSLGRFQASEAGWSELP